MKNITIMLIVALGGVVISGCARPEQAASSDPLCLSGVSVSDTMEAAKTVLEQMRFSIEKYDLQARYIRTRPLSGAQFFQIWRQDNASSYAAAQANVQSLRRVVEMEVTQQPDQTCLECRVIVQQLSIPERPIENIRGVAGIYTDSSTSNQTLSLKDEQLEKMEWLDNGPDRALEKKILEKIKKEVTR